MSDPHGVYDLHDETVASMESGWGAVRFAHGGEEATSDRSILEDPGVPVLPGGDVGLAPSRRTSLPGGPILVSGSCPDRASEIIAADEAVWSGKQDADDDFDDDDEADEDEHFFPDDADDDFDDDDDDDDCNDDDFDDL